MDKEFSSALHKAIDKFGKEIVKEKRFVDIVSDYYPAMAVDHPAWKKVLTAIIVEGFGNDILICNNSVDARICVDKYTALVAKKNGFDKKLVEAILIELSTTLGMSVATPSPARPVKPINAQPQSKKKVSTKPTPNPTTNGNGSNKPSPNTKPNGNANKSPKHIFTKHKKLIAIIVISVILLIVIGSAVYGFFNDNLWNDIDFPILFFGIDGQY